MDNPDRVRLQVRAVLVVYRAEVARIRRYSASPKVLRADLDDLRARSLKRLDEAGAGLDGSAAWHPELVKEIDRARVLLIAEGD
jgi:hypothetical protein